MRTSFDFLLTFYSHHGRAHSSYLIRTESDHPTGALAILKARRGITLRLGTTMELPKLIVFILSNFVMTIALFWGLWTIIELARQKKGSGHSILQEAVSEKSVQIDEQSGKIGSFSRVAGAFGALALAVAVIGISYWLVYALFYAEDIAVLKQAGWFFLSGSALFAPYAFNQLSSIFKMS